jgi:hypothetical protein
MPLYPAKVRQARECAPIPPFIIFTFGLTIESIKELGGVSIVDFHKGKNYFKFYIYVCKYFI